MSFPVPVPATLIACFYEGIATPGRTAEGLQQMAGLLGCDRVSLALQEGGGSWGRAYHASLQPHGWRLHVEENFTPAAPVRQKWLGLKPETWHAIEHNHQHWHAPTDLVEEGPNQLAVGIRLAVGNGYDAFLSLQKNKARVHGESDPARSADAMLKPLRTALGIIAQIRQASQQAAHLSTVLDCIRLPLLMLDRSMRVLAANTAAKSLIQNLCGDLSGAARITLAGISGERFAPLVKRACGESGTAAASSVQITADHRQAAMQMMVLPVLAGAAQPAALILIHGQQVAQQDAADLLLQNIYGLTPAEARLALLILAGESPGTAAAQLRVSLPTVRTQLSAVLKKTGAPRQSDLVRRLSALLLVNQRLAKR